ncbi:MAG: 2-dehydropantoate 2-reductase [Chitinivibrionales bacterium]|nr:2-dehydropantoate 2-reductase [Chitinivibrionales bacterium]
MIWGPGMIHYVIYGAGAVGSALGGALARTGMNATLIARKAHCDAITARGGLTMVTLEGKQIQPIRAVQTLKELSLDTRTVIFMTMKATDTIEALDEIMGLDQSVPVVCWQNGMGNEDLVAQRFSRVYGGVVRFTATMLTPGEIRYAGPGKLILGVYPSGLDDLACDMVQDLTAAGFTTLTSTRIMDDKWLKLLVNLISCVRPMLKRTPEEPALRTRIGEHILREGVAVLNAAGIPAKSTNGTEDSAEAMLEKFSPTLRLAEGEGQGMKLQNSTWQSLARKSRDLENDWYTGVIIKLGEKYGIPTPWNRMVLTTLHTIADQGLGPESVNAEEIVRKGNNEVVE